MDKLESSYGQVLFFPKKKEDGNFQKIVFVSFKLEQMIYLLDVMIFVFDKRVTNKPTHNVR